MDGETHPPRYCVTDKQKGRWRERQLLKILKASNIEKDLTLEIQKIYMAKLEETGDLHSYIEYEEKYGNEDFVKAAEEVMRKNLG